MADTVFVWVGNSNDPFQCSTFGGGREEALSLGYVEVSRSDYIKLRKMELKWNNNGELIKA